MFNYTLLRFGLRGLPEAGRTQKKKSSTVKERGCGGTGREQSSPHARTEKLRGKVMACDLWQDLFFHHPLLPGHPSSEQRWPLRPSSQPARVTAWRRWIIYCSGCDTWGVAILSSFMRSWKKKKKNTDKTNRNYPGNNVTCAQLDARWENSVFSVLSKVLFTCSDVTMRSLGSALLLAVYAGCFSRQFCSWSWCWTTSACAALNHSLFTVSAVSYSYCCRCRRRDIKQSKELDMCEVWSLDYVWNWMSISLLSSQTKMPLYLSLLVTKAYECACTHTRTHTAFKMKMFI